MESNVKNKKRFGLLGKNISYSFSRGYFSKKFKKLELDNCEYVNFDIPTISKLPTIIKENRDILYGINVTIPYKQEVFSYLDKVDEKARKIGAVNTIKVTKKGRLKGYNTDEFGFRKSLKPLLQSNHKKALVLGTGGASKAVAFALQKLNIDYKFVSRKATTNNFSYKDLTKEILESFSIIINCTPLGTHPNVEVCPDIPYQFLTRHHLLYDLIYNPSETLFLQKGKKKGAIIKNGLEMLELQAEKAWVIWNR